MVAEYHCGIHDECIYFSSVMLVLCGGASASPLLVVPKIMYAVVPGEVSTTLRDSMPTLAFIYSCLAEIYLMPGVKITRRRNEYMCTVLAVMRPVRTSRVTMLEKALAFIP